MKVIANDQAPTADTQWQPGDLVAFWGRCWKSRVIEAATAGPSHVGIIANYGGRPTLFESTTLTNLQCVVRGRTIEGVQGHYVWDRIRSYDGHCRRVPISPAWRFSREESSLLSWALTQHWIGRPYNLKGALLSGTRVFKWTRFMPYPDSGSLFCSELAAAILMRFGRFPLDNPTRYHPASLIRRARECGTYQRPEEIRGAAKTFAVM